MFLKQLSEYVHKDHNRRNGYSDYEQKNVAIGDSNKKLLLFWIA